MKIIKLLACIGVLLLGCKTNEKAAGQGQVIAFEEIDSGTYCGIEEASDQWIRSQEAWENLWERMNAGRKPVPPLPEIDFSTQSVVACFMGSQSSGGYAVTIKEIRLENRQLTVTRNYLQPGRNCALSMALTQPYFLVVLPEVEAEAAVFQGDSIMEDCE